ncbi:MULTISPECIES: LexA family transcriptional regulator [unclassified Lactobacillus]|uniref:LexA family protein n=1 Tax=unclassified Lactobacillus TaxID=2620435 RepID=UPI000EFB6349|nr:MULTISPECIES: LexA family transcriptional regulator [unclassified Lactobacillus]RMC24461.1 helix-turn-helix domain-containing protein [Lactobacillus sp. ESL0247]RMC28600.1 helix-turn-helix domain-containing protein [Lactobacillus sp. ESL0246]RMC31792.1 helix-turn-helix domain-containing protein [Lactobacillus sp. ESL0245]RMC46584.1 helix-turn-helix domain-containing protein [Lactobacillus sp. ESL0230]
MKTSRQIIDELNELRKEQGMSITELAKHVGMAKSGVSKYFNHTREFPINRTPEFAKALHTTVEKVLGVDNSQSDLDPKFPSNAIDLSNLHHVRIPIVGDIACGTPITAEQNVEGYHDVYLKHVPAGKLFALRCKGDSMEPRIPNGAYVTILQQPTIETNEVAAVLINGEATLKQFKQMDSKHAILYPFNTKYEPIFLDGNDDVKILGKAIHYDGEL